MKEDVDDRYAGIDIDSLLNRTDHRPLSYGRKKALYEAPEFIQRLNGEETVMEGQSLCIECKIRGFPVPTLRWFKDDEEILDHPRIHVESNGTGGYSLIIDNAHKGDEAAYRCRAENVEGACSSFFFLSVKSRPKSQKKKDQKNSASRRTVSFPPMFATIVEKVEEEEKQGKEFQQLPPSPMTDFYYAMTLKGRQSWPTFLGDWAFANGGHSHKRRNSTGSINTESCECSSEDEVFTDEDDDGDEGSDEPQARKPFFFLAEDTDSSDSSPTESLTVFNSNIHTSPQGHTEVKSDLQNNNALASKEVLDNERKHVTELSQPELYKLDAARKAEDSNRLGCNVEYRIADVEVLYPDNKGSMTPPIVVELWDELNAAGDRPNIPNQMDSSSTTDTKSNTLTSTQFSREEREPTPFFRSDDTKVVAPKLEEKPKQRSLHIPGQTLTTETTKEFHRELTPFYENKSKTQLDSTDMSALSLGVPDSVGFQRELTPFYKDVLSKSQPSQRGNGTLSPPASLNVPIAVVETGDTRESTSYYSESEACEVTDCHLTVGQDQKRIQEAKTAPNTSRPFVTLQPQEFKPISDTSQQTVRPKLQSTPQKDLTLDTQVAAKTPNSKTPQLVMSSPQTSESIDPGPSKSKETLATQKPSTLKCVNKASLFASSALANPVLSLPSQQASSDNQPITGQPTKSDNQPITGQPTKSDILAQKTSQPKAELESQKQGQRLPLKPSTLDIKKTEPGQMFPAILQQESASKTQPGQMFSAILQQESASKTHVQHNRGSSKISQTTNLDLEIPSLVVNISKSQTENTVRKDVQPNQAEDLRQKTSLKETINASSMQVTYAPISSHERDNPSTESKLQEFKPPVGDQAPYGSSEATTIGLGKPNTYSETQPRSTSREAPIANASPQTSSIPQLSYPIMFQETNEAQQELAPRQLRVSAKNIYPVEVIANESSNQTTSTPGAANQKTDTLKTSKQKARKLESANQSNIILSEDSAGKKKKKKSAKTGFSNSISAFFTPKRKTDKTDKADKADKADKIDTKNVKEKSKRSVFAKTGNTNKTPNTAPPSAAEVPQEQPVRQRFVSRQTLAKCSPFGPYTLEGLCCLFILTIFCVHIEMSVEKFTCYVLAAFYTFCVMRLLGVIN